MEVQKFQLNLGLLPPLIKKTDYLIIVGAMANNFVKFKGNNIGKSLVEIDTENNIKEILEEAEKNNCKIILPSDFAVSSSPKVRLILKILKM